MKVRMAIDGFESVSSELDHTNRVINQREFFRVQDRERIDHYWNVGIGQNLEINLIRKKSFPIIVRRKKFSILSPMKSFLFVRIGSLSLAQVILIMDTIVMEIGWIEILLI